MFRIILIIICVFSLTACTEKLNVKPNQGLQLPQTVGDYQALLDMPGMNTNVPGYGEVGADNYYVSDTRYTLLPYQFDRNAYVWAPEIFAPVDVVYDWQGGYLRIFNCNLVLEGLTKLKDSTKTAAYKNVLGSALFLRAFSYYTMAQVFCPPYDSATAKTALGLPIRTSTDMEEVYPRSRLQPTYDQIISDLQQALTALPDVTVYNTRPSKAAADALLSRLYLSVGNYDLAFQYADASLKLFPTLLNYNDYDTTVSLPFPITNNEVLFWGQASTISILTPSNALVDTTLYNSYNAHDLRRSLFFKKTAAGHSFKGYYSNTSLAHFGGISAAEIYLNRAECYARKGQIQAAMDDLNTLLKTRWADGYFVPFTAASADEALRIILTERRKELAFRGLRWIDLRRLNKDPRFAITLKRVVNGATDSLPPNDQRYTYPIPPMETSVSGIEQNPRTP
jgi:starch-binding outer membrane protein, SusD/RagB family